MGSVTTCAGEDNGEGFRPAIGSEGFQKSIDERRHGVREEKSFFDKVAAFDSKKMAWWEDMDFTWLYRSAGRGPRNGQTTLARENFDQMTFAIRRKMAGDNKGGMEVAWNLCKKSTKGFHSPCRTSHNGNRKFFRIGGRINRGLGAA
jgi:hypothetical protein